MWIILSTLTNYISKKTLGYLYIRYIVNANALFSQWKHFDFWNLLQYINLIANSLLPNFNNTICSWVFDIFTECKQQISLILQSTFSSIYIICNILILLNYSDDWGIIVYLSLESDLLHKLLFLLSEQKDSYSNFNQMQLIMKILNLINIWNCLKLFGPLYYA